MAKLLENISKVVRGELPPPPIARLLGFELTFAEPGKAVVELEANASHANPMGTLHGGVLCDIADAAMGIAYAAGLEEGETFTTLELKINFLKPVWNSRLTASAKVIRQGRTIGLVECDVTDSNGSLVAHSTCTCMTLRGADATGR
jgi:uncharacterized protein (TIGR00369 family)